MDYRNKKHKITFEEAIRKKDKKNYAAISALYLLTADSQLWQTVRHYVVNNAISFEQIVLNGTSTNRSKFRPETVSAPLQSINRCQKANTMRQ